MHKFFYLDLTLGVRAAPAIVGLVGVRAALAIMGRVGQVGQVRRVRRVGRVRCHVLKMVYSYFASLIYVFYFLS